MVTQANPPNTSSTIQVAGVPLEDVLAVVKELAKRDFGKFLKFYRQFEAFMERHSRRVVLEVANLDDSGGVRFRRMFPWYAQIGDDELLALRNQLRQSWARKQGVTYQILKGWADWRPTGAGAQAWMPFLPSGRVLPAAGNLRGVLAIGVMENLPRLTVCANPECPARYFLAKRRDQKYCERGECTAYAQRQYALKWWRDKGDKRRRNRKKSKGKPERARTKRRKKR